MPTNGQDRARGAHPEREDAAPGDGAFDPFAITRPDDALLKYYLITAALTVVGFPFAIGPLYFKFKTLRYRFDDRGVSMSWGLLFKREVYLTYRRIQDIHVTRNIIHRWLGLSRVAVQTASGAASAEMTIEGIRNPELLRDFLYEQMRGAKGETGEEEAAATSEQPAEADETLALLREIRDGLRALADQREAQP
jgi:putative membrane protein